MRPKAVASWAVLAASICGVAVGLLAALRPRQTLASQGQVTATAISAKFNLNASSIVFIKVPKVGGSTAAGVFRRVAKHRNLSGYADAGWIRREPGVWANHGTLQAMGPKLQLMHGPTLLVTWVRDPVERCLSQFYDFDVSRRKTPPTDENKINALQGCENENFKYVRPSARATVAETMRVYGFVGSTDRFDESMVALKLTFGLTFGDILYLRSKDSASARNPGKKSKHHHRTRVRVPHPPLSEESEAVQQQARSDNFRARNAQDTELLQAVGAQLDSAARRFAKFEEELAEYRQMLRSARGRCQHAADKCYWNDHGCGYECLDEIAARDRAKPR